MTMMVMRMVIMMVMMMMMMVRVMMQKWQMNMTIHDARMRRRIMLPQHWWVKIRNTHTHTHTRTHTRTPPTIIIIPTTAATTTAATQSKCCIAISFFKILTATVTWLGSVDILGRRNDSGEEEDAFPVGVFFFFLFPADAAFLFRCLRSILYVVPLIFVLLEQSAMIISASSAPVTVGVGV